MENNPLNNKFFEFIAETYPNEDIKVVAYGEENFSTTVPSSVFNLDWVIKNQQIRAVEKISFCPHLDKKTRFLVLDLDFKGVSEEVKRQVLDKTILVLQEGLNIKPNVIINSGTGFHIYYRFEYLPVTKYGILVGAVDLKLREHKLDIFVDKKSYSLNAYFRVPGVINTKRVGGVKLLENGFVKVGDLVVKIDEVLKNPEKFGVYYSTVEFLDDSFSNQVDEELINTYKNIYVGGTKSFVYTLEGLTELEPLSDEMIKKFYQNAGKLKNRISDEYWETIYDWFKNGGLIRKGKRHNCLIRLGLSLVYWFGRPAAQRFLTNNKIFEDQDNFYKEERLEVLLDSWENICSKTAVILEKMNKNEGEEDKIFDYNEFFDNYIFFYNRPLQEVIVVNSVDNVGYFLVFENGEIKYLHRSMKIETLIENLLPVDYSEYGIKLLEEVINYVKSRKTPNGSKLNTMFLIRYLLKYLDERDVLIRESDTAEAKEDKLLKSIQTVTGEKSIAVLKNGEYEYTLGGVNVKKDIGTPQLIVLLDEMKLCVTTTLMDMCIGEIKNEIKNQITGSGSNMVDMAIQKIYPSKTFKLTTGPHKYCIIDGNKYKRVWTYIVGELVKKEESET